MREFDPEFSSGAVHEMIAPDIPRKLARHCLMLCRDDPEAAHTFLIPKMDYPEQTKVVCISPAQPEAHYDPDSFLYRALKILKLADYFRPLSFNVLIWPDPKKAVKGKLAPYILTIDTSNDGLAGLTNEGEILTLLEIQEYADYILNIAPAHETTMPLAAGQGDAAIEQRPTEH